MPQQNCVLGGPIYYDTITKAFEPITNGMMLDGAEKSWNFSTTSCQISGTSTPPSYMEFISTTSGTLWLDKSLSVGDVLLVVFILVFSFGKIMDFILKFIFKTGVSFKR